MTISARSLLCATVGAAIFLLGLWTECHSSEFFSVTWPDGSPHNIYSTEITHASWVLMASGALSLIAAGFWIRAGSPVEPNLF